MAVITLSRQLGSHGEEIATAVAQSLGLRLVNAATIYEAAQRAGVPEVALAELQQEGERGLASQVLKALRAMPILPGAESPAATGLQGTEPLAAEWPGLAHPFVGLFSPLAPPLSASLDSWVRTVGSVIRSLAREGDVLVIGRGGQVLLRNHPGSLHVQIVAPVPYRVERLMAALKLSKRQAQDRVRTSDRARADYLRRYHNVDWLDPTLYHLVINTGRVTVQTAIDLIIATHQAMHPRPPSPAEEEVNDAPAA